MQHERLLYRIPDYYAGPYEGGTGNFYTWMDSQITIRDGKAYETHMGLNADATSHEFVTSEWKGEAGDE